METTLTTAQSARLDESRNDFRAAIAEQRQQMLTNPSAFRFCESETPKATKTPTKQTKPAQLQLF